MPRKMIMTSFEGFTFPCVKCFPEFLARFVTPNLLRYCEENYQTTAERISFLCVASIARAAYLRIPTTDQGRSDRAFAKRLIRTNRPIVMDWTFELMVTSLGSSVEAITGFPSRRKKAMAKRAAEVERQRLELEQLYREANERALAEARQALEALEG